MVKNKITAVLGPTNTGKTFMAIETMLSFDSRMIGFPLRLLAREVYDKITKKINSDKVALITGEEKIIPSNAKYFLCTVESMPIEKNLEFVGIDEIQMCADYERGHIFTDRLLNLRGEKLTMLMGSNTIKNLILKLDEETNKLNIGMRGDSKRNFNLGLIDIHEKEQKIPDLNFDSSVEMDSSMFNDSIEDMGIISDSVSLSIKNNIFLVEAMGTTNQAKVEIISSEKTKVNLEGEKEEVKSKYSVTYLKKILKGGKLTDKVNLRFGQDYPLQIEYKVTDKLHFMTLLAPRVSND